MIVLSIGGMFVIFFLAMAFVAWAKERSGAWPGLALAVFVGTPFALIGWLVWAAS